MHSTHPYSNLRSPQLSYHQFNCIRGNSLSDEIINSSKTLMSIRLIEIQNQILQRFEQYPVQQKHMLRQMLYQNMESLPTLQDKIYFLLSLIQKKDLSRLNLYVKQTQATPKLITQSSSNTNHSPLGQDINFYHTPQQYQTSPHNQDTSFFRQSINPTYHKNGSLHKYYSQGTLDTVLPDESLYSSVVNSQQSEELKNFMELSRRKKMEAKQKRVSNLIESGKICQQLKLLKMSKKLSQYQGRIKPPGITSVRQANTKLSSERGQELNKNYIQTNGGRKDNLMNRSFRQRLNEEPKMSFDGHQQGKYELKDQFSFRQGLNSSNDGNTPNLCKSYIQKQFQTHQNGTFDELDHNISMTQKTSFNHAYSGYQDNNKSRDHSYSQQNDQSYESNLRKLKRLRKEKVDKQKNERVSTKNLDQRIQSLFHINDRSGNNTGNNNFSKNTIKTDPKYRGQSGRENNTKTNRSIFYTQSEDTSMCAQEELDYKNDKQNRNYSKEKIGQSRSPSNKHGYFRKKTFENPSFTTILSKPNHSKASNKHISNKSNKSHSESSLSRQLSHKSKKNAQKMYSKQQINKQKELRKQKIPFEKKFIWVRQDGDLGDFELDPSQFSPQVKEYFMKRRKVIPSMIPSIIYRKDESNQTQLVNRKTLQNARQMEVQQKLTQKSNSLQLLRMKLNQLDF